MWWAAGAVGVVVGKVGGVVGRGAAVKRGWVRGGAEVGARTVVVDGATPVLLLGVS